MKKNKNNFSKRYNINKSFEYNREKGPYEKIKDRNNIIKKNLSKYGIETDFFGYKTKLPIGVAAGPLYNKKYMEGAMNDGFTVITWKTFRSVNRLAHKNNGDFLGHNIVYLNPKQDVFSKQDLIIKGSLDFNGNKEEITITNSFGMPSKEVKFWLKDIEDIEKVSKKKNKLIITSVVGTPKEDGDIYDLATDYAYTAKSAEMMGSKVIELNLSCPNVHGKEGQIYKDSNNAMIISKTVRNLLNKETKLLLKVGFAEVSNYEEFINKTHKYIDGIVAINTIPMKIVDEKGKQALPGGITSGVCGDIIIDKSVEAIKNLIKARENLKIKKENLKIIGCGGVTNVENFMKHIEAGAEFVMCATAALFNPDLPQDIANYIKNNKIKMKI